MSFDRKIVLLVGGVGGAKLAHGLYQSIPSKNLTIIVNTGDDFWHYGLRICPDLDTITYTLSGLVNKQNGWGVADDTFITIDMLKQLGDDPWFRLGDRDLALHLKRTQLLHEGLTLTEVTKRIASCLDIGCTILPMTDAAIATRVETQEYGEIAFQEYFVKYRWQPRVTALRFVGTDDASLSQAVCNALEEADCIIIGPSNPWLSIQPILRVPGLLDVIRERQVPRIAVTPLIAGNAVKGPTAKLMREFSLEVSTRSVVEYYLETINGFVYDVRDALDDVPDVHMTALDTLMDSEMKRVTLAQEMLAWLNRDWNKFL